MPKYVYVECQLSELNVDLISATNVLFEKILNTPIPDVIPPCHASQMTFRHTFIDAKDDDEAYALGGRYFDRVGGRKPNTAMNDYVVRLED